MNPTDTFAQARELLLRLRIDQPAAHAAFRWPQLDNFNWALDWFDSFAAGNARPALRLVQELESGREHELVRTYAELSESSNRVANFLRAHGVGPGERVLVMLGNVLPLWESMLAAIKLGAVVVPCSLQLTPADLADRIVRGEARHAIVDASSAERLAKVPEAAQLRLKLVVGGTRDGFIPFENAYAGESDFAPLRPTLASDPLLLYFTSGTTAKPKLVLHTHVSYPIGHLSTMYWLGLREGDVHQNISSPGWAKHAWSSFFAPWNAGATLLMHDAPRFNSRRQLELLRTRGVGSLCCPPTVWRMLVLEDLGARPEALRELVSAGEPLNPEVIEAVRSAWELTIRDGFGQTETTCAVGNAPGQLVKVGSMGRPLPGYDVVLLDHEGREASEGEIALRLTPRPLSLMAGYIDDPERTAAAMAGGYYRTGDEAQRDADGYFHYVGRGDDVFKSSDYRISPFELESALLEHPAVAEAAIVPSPDPVRLAVPKAFVVLKPLVAQDAGTAREILLFAKERLAPYKRIRRIEFAELPKTISGKIRRVQLRAQELERRARQQRGPLEFFLEEFEHRSGDPESTPEEPDDPGDAA